MLWLATSPSTWSALRAASASASVRYCRASLWPTLCVCRLPLGRFDALTVGFGIRNVCGLSEALVEMFRVLRPGGQVAILEFSTPRTKVLRNLYRFYFHRILPRVGAWISGSTAGKGAYEYLPKSVAEFPTPDGLASVLREFGFADVRYRSFTCGIAVLHTARRPQEDIVAPKPIAEVGRE